jgi:antibiotic biosynthesis monooxygenase (ABM) superfamily enzyme
MIEMTVMVSMAGVLYLASWVDGHARKAWVKRNANHTDR